MSFPAVSLFQKKNEVKPCSQDTEKPCGHRVELPQHNKTSRL